MFWHAIAARQFLQSMIALLVSCLIADNVSLTADDSASVKTIRAVEDAESGQIDIFDGTQPVLRYNYKTVPAPERFLEELPAEHRVDARKYGRPRSNYIHPLYGLNGEQLTADWNKDHPHHRGIYWAWPEVQYKGQMGDLHALQRVFARPTGRITLRHEENFAEIEAESRWMWEDKMPIVHELATIRAWQVGQHGRNIDLMFRITALKDDVSIARRETTSYGGLNIRLAPVDELNLSHYADTTAAKTRHAWQSATGIWSGTKSPLSLYVVEHAENPHYPGDYVQFPDLPWFQPTFPRAGTRYALENGKPLVLRYRLWIRVGDAPSKEDARAQWKAFNSTSS